MSEPDDLSILQSAQPIDRCPDCGYPREGLPADRLCPECGWQPADDIIVIYVDGVMRTTNWDPRPLVATVGGILIFLAIAFGRRLLPTPARGWIFIVPVFIGFTIAAQWYRRSLKRETGGLLQLRLGPGGYSVRIGFGRPAWKRWRRWTIVCVSRPFLIKWRLQIGPGVPLLNIPVSWQVDVEAPGDPPYRAAIERQCGRWRDA